MALTIKKELTSERRGERLDGKEWSNSHKMVTELFEVTIFFDIEHVTSDSIPHVINVFYTACLETPELRQKKETITINFRLIAIVDLPQET